MNTPEILRVASIFFLAAAAGLIVYAKIKINEAGKRHKKLMQKKEEAMGRKTELRVIKTPRTEKFTLMKRVLKVVLTDGVVLDFPADDYVEKDLHSEGGVLSAYKSKYESNVDSDHAYIGQKNRCFDIEEHADGYLSVLDNKNLHRICKSHVQRYFYEEQGILKEEEVALNSWEVIEVVK
jgi:hypothetical protein